MTEEEIHRYITDKFEGITTYSTADSIAEGDTFYFYDPEQKFPFVTLVTGDRYDSFSNLDRPGVYRLNIGIGKETFRKMFGPAAVPSEGGESGYSVLDKLFPHPVYGKMYWVSVLNPSEATFELHVRQLLDEAYAISVRRYSRKASEEARK